MHQPMVITEHHRAQARQEWMDALQRSTGKPMIQLQEIAKKMEDGVYQKSTSLADYQEKTRDRIHSSIAKLTGGHNFASNAQHSAAQYQARAQQMQAAGMGRPPTQPGHMPGMQQPMNMGGHPAQGMGMHSSQGGQHMPMGHQGMATHAGMMPMRTASYGSQPMQGMGQQHMSHMPTSQPDLTYAPPAPQGMLEDTDFSDFLSTFTASDPAGQPIRNPPPPMAQSSSMYPGMGMHGGQGMQPMQQSGAGMGGYGQSALPAQPPGFGMSAGVPGQYSSAGAQSDRGMMVGSYMQSGQPGMQGMQGSNRPPGSAPGLPGQQQQQQQVARGMPGMPAAQAGPNAQQMQRPGYGNVPQTWPQQMIPVGQTQQQQQQAPPQAPSPAGQPGMQPQHRAQPGVVGAGGAQQMGGAAGAGGVQGPGGARVGAGMAPPGMAPTEEMFWQLHGEMRVQYLDQLKTYLVRCESSLKPKPGQPPPDEATAKKNRDRIELFRSMIGMLSHARGTPGAPAPTREHYQMLYKWRNGVCKTLDTIAQKPLGQQGQQQQGAAGVAGGASMMQQGAMQHAGAAGGAGGQQAGMPPLPPGGLQGTAAPAPPPRLGAAGTPGLMALPVHTPPNNATTPPPAIPMPTAQHVQPLRPASAQPAQQPAGQPPVPPPASAHVVPGAPDGMMVKTEVGAVAKSGHKETLEKVQRLLSLLEESTSGTLPGRPNQATPLVQVSALHNPMLTPPLPAWVLPPSPAAHPPSHASHATISLPTFVCNANGQAPEVATIPIPVLASLGLAPTAPTATKPDSLGAVDGGATSDDDMDELPAVLRVPGMVPSEPGGEVEEGRQVKRRRWTLDPQVIQEALRKVVLSGCRLSVGMSRAIAAPRDTTQLQLTFSETASLETVSAAPAWHRLHVCVATAALHALLDSGPGSKGGVGGVQLQYLQDMDVGCIPCLPFFASSDAGYDDQRGQMARAHFQAFLDADAAGHPAAGPAPPLLLHQAAAQWQRAVLNVMSAIKAAGSGRSLSSAEGNSRPPLMPGGSTNTPALTQTLAAVG